jgi:hypothetical protein
MKRKYPGLIVKEEESWAAIEAEARAQALAYLDAEQTAPASEWGSFVAWSEHGYLGRTDGVSHVHRVGPTLPSRVTLTLCGEVVASAKSRLTLSAAIVKALGRCHRCEARYEKQGIAA